MLPSAILCALAAASPSLDGLAAVRSVLQRNEATTTCKDEVLVRRLTALGPDTAPTLFRLVTGEAMDELIGETEPEAWLCSPDDVGSLALETLANLPEAPVLAALRAAVAAKPERSERVSAFFVLGRLASSGGLPLYFQLLEECGDEIEMRSVRAPAVDALAAIVRKDGQAAVVLENPLLAAPLAQQRLACEALGASGRAEACTLMQKLIGKDPELDLVVLESLTALAERYPWRMTDNTLALVRAGLQHANPELRAAAARALGRVRDGKSLANLVSLLADEDADTVRAALWALRECTGQARLTTKDDWQAWLESERLWWKQEGKARTDELAQGDVSHLAQIVRDAQKHAFARPAVADALLATLDELPPEAKQLACSTLAQFGARQAVPALVELLFEKDADVRAAAWTALRMLTGENLPAEPRLWEKYAFG